jgi:hypothetical protein
MQKSESAVDVQPTPCGIVMPISPMGDCSEGHWADVLNILTDAVSAVGFRADLVSNADEVTVIQKTIVQNLYNTPILVCDVSEKNPNVMFELGLRLAFDKPAIIVKDDRTSFSFDTGVEFKRRLGEKVLATYEKYNGDPSFSTFLSHFGQFKIASIDEKEVSGQEYIIEQIAEIRKKVDGLTVPPASARRPLNFPAGDEMDICCGPMNEAEIKQLDDTLRHEPGIISVRYVNVDNHQHLFARADFKNITDRREKERRFQTLAKSLRNKSRRRRIEEHDGASDGTEH